MLNELTFKGLPKNQALFLVERVEDIKSQHIQKLDVDVEVVLSDRSDITYITTIWVYNNIFAIKIVHNYLDRYNEDIIESFIGITTGYEALKKMKNYAKDNDFHFDYKI